MAKLIFIDGKHAGRVYNLVLEKTTVGRGDQNTLVIHDNSLSSKHCEILVYGPEVIVRDLDSRNGTFVNGARLANQQAQLKSGQTVRFGSVEARLELDEPSFDDTASEETAVFAMRRSQRDRRREAKLPKPPDPSVTLEADTDASLSEHTVMLHKPSQPEATTTPQVPQTAEGPRRRTALVRSILAVAALALGLALLWWLIRGIK
jgi:ferric-dicitrate binding protein FerR (iron transport regulator)